MVRIGEVKVIDDSIDEKSRNRKIEDVEKYLKGEAVIHNGECYLHDYFLKEYKRCTYLSWVYNLTWKCNTYEIELNHIAKINGISVDKMQKIVSELIEKYYNEEGTLDLIIEELIEKHNKVENYELFEHWMK